MTRRSYRGFSMTEREVVAFYSAEEAWFWFVCSRLAQEEGAGYSRGQAVIARPCEPMDVLNCLMRLYRQRRLLPDHLRVLARYGRAMLPPDPASPRQERASRLWREAMTTLEAPLIAKGIVKNAFLPADTSITGREELPQAFQQLA